MNTNDFHKKCERLQLRVSPRTLQRIRILSQTHGDSMAAYIESLVNTAWDEQVCILGYDFDSWLRMPLKKVD